MQAKPAPLGVTRTLMTWGSAGGEGVRRTRQPGAAVREGRDGVAGARRWCGGRSVAAGRAGTPVGLEVRVVRARTPVGRARKCSGAGLRARYGAAVPNL